MACNEHKIPIHAVRNVLRNPTMAGSPCSPITPIEVLHWLLSALQPLSTLLPRHLPQ